MNLVAPVPGSTEFNILNSRYTGQLIIFGQKFQTLISNLKFFLVGCGALGCEFVKNYGMVKK